MKLLGGYLYAFEIPVYDGRGSSSSESDMHYNKESETKELVDTVIDDAIFEEHQEETDAESEVNSQGDRKEQPNGQGDEEVESNGDERRPRTLSCLSEKQQVTKHPLTPIRPSGATVTIERQPQPVASTSNGQGVPPSVYERFVIAIHRKMVS